MDALCFDIKAPYASFRIPSTTRGYMTFPIPPRTTIMGLIGSILGIERNEMYLSENFLHDAEIAIQTMNKPMTVNFRTNQIQTRYLYSGLGSGVKIYIPGNLDRGVRSPQNIVLLPNVHYRLFVSIKNSDKLKELERRIKEHKYVYPPYLGRANYLASIEFIDVLELKELKEFNNAVEIISICAFNTQSEINMGNYTIIANVPMAYKAKKTSKGIKLEPGLLSHIIYSDKPIRVMPSKSVYQIQNCNVEELKGKNLMFLPYN